MMALLGVTWFCSCGAKAWMPDNDPPSGWLLRSPHDAVCRTCQHNGPEGG